MGLQVIRGVSRAIWELLSSFPGAAVSASAKSTTNSAVHVPCPPKKRHKTLWSAQSTLDVLATSGWQRHLKSCPGAGSRIRSTIPWLICLSIPLQFGGPDLHHLCAWADPPFSPHIFWSATTQKKDLKLLESVQRRAKKMMKDLEEPHEEWLRSLCSAGEEEPMVRSQLLRRSSSNLCSL